MSTDSASTTQEDASPFHTELVACGQTGHLRALDRILRPASPTSEVWDTETQYNSVGHRDEQAQGEIAESPTAEAHPVLAPSHLHDSSSCSDGKENRPPGLVFQVAVSDTCHRVEANGSIDSGQDEQIELEFGFPSSQACSNHLEDAWLRSPEQRWQAPRQRHRRQRVQKFRRSKRPAVEEC
ncbi:hypothetical protein HRG_013824 [Hirsutella rhossiliensis]